MCWSKVYGFSAEHFKVPRYFAHTQFSFSPSILTHVMHLCVCVFVFEWTHITGEHEYMCVHVEAWVL